MSKTKKKQKGRVIHDYEPESYTFGQIAVAEGDIIDVVELGQDGWTEVFLIWSQKKGVIPTDFIELYEEAEPLQYTKEEAAKILTPFFKDRRKKRKLKEYMDKFSQIKQRNNLIREILETERTYVNYMTIFVEIFMKPLKAKKIVDDTIIKKLFSNLEQIHQINTLFFKELEKGMVNFPQQQSFGNSVKTIAPFFKSYTTYVNNFQTSRETFANLEKTNPKFQEFISEIYQKKDIQGQKFNSLLIMPVQRLPRYKMLFEQVLKYTAEDHIERSNIEEALKQVSEIADFVNENQRLLENQKVLIQVSSLIKDKYPTLVQPYRQFKKEGTINLTIVDRKVSNDTYKIYLFSDILVLLEDKQNVKVKKLISFFILLPFTKLEDNEKNTDITLLTIMEGKKLTLTFSCQTDTEKNDWITAFKSCYDDIANFLERKSIKDSYELGLERASLLFNIEDTRLKLVQGTLSFNQAKSSLFNCDREIILYERQLEEMKKKSAQLKEHKKRIDEELIFISNSYVAPKESLSTNLKKISEMDPFYMETLKEEKCAFQEIFNDQPVTQEVYDEILSKFPDLVLPNGVTRSPSNRSSSVISRPLPLPQPKIEVNPLQSKTPDTNKPLPPQKMLRGSFIEIPKRSESITPPPVPRRGSINVTDHNTLKVPSKELRGSFDKIQVNLDQPVSPEVKRKELPKPPPRKIQ